MGTPFSQFTIYPTGLQSSIRVSRGLRFSMRRSLQRYSPPNTKQCSFVSMCSMYLPYSSMTSAMALANLYQNLVKTISSKFWAIFFMKLKAQGLRDMYPFCLLYDTQKSCSFWRQGFQLSRVSSSSSNNVFLEQFLELRQICTLRCYSSKTEGSGKESPLRRICMLSLRCFLIEGLAPVRLFISAPTQQSFALLAVVATILKKACESRLRVLSSSSLQVNSLSCCMPPSPPIPPICLLSSFFCEISSRVRALLSFSSSSCRLLRMW